MFDLIIASFEVVYIQDFLYRPIEKLSTANNHWNPKIIENKEPLIKVQFEPKRLYIKPIYFEQEIPSSIKFIYLREGVYRRLKQALAMLPEQYSFILYDGYRPFQVQQSLFEMFSQSIKDKQPHLTKDEVHKETLKYVAFPSIEPTRTSPHVTGGAIDLTLGDCDGNVLDLGTYFDEMSVKSATRYFEDHPMDNEVALINRRILYNCMTAVGFSNYSEEWWHYDFGNLSWARRVKLENVQYGPVLADLQNNDIKEFRYV